MRIYRRSQLEALSVTLLFVSLVCCESRLEEATIHRVERAQTSWKASRHENYHIIVDVKREGELRRNDVTVKQGHIVEASVAYWDTKRNAWTPYGSLTHAQALPFTVPGLFEMVREELLNGNRSGIRIRLEGNPPFPQIIRLDPVMRNHQTVAGTKALITVESYQLL